MIWGDRRLMKSQTNLKNKNIDHKEKESPGTISGRIKQEGHGEMRALPITQI